MDRAQEERVAVGVVRLVGMVAVFVGLMLVTHGVIGSLAERAEQHFLPPHIETMRAELEFMRGKMDMLYWRLAGNTAVVAWGVILYGMAKCLGRRIVGGVGDEGR